MHLLLNMGLSIIEIGKYNRLKVIKTTDFGIYVGDEVEEILMPAKWVPEGTQDGDEIEAFVYTDSEDRLIATTLKPTVERDQFAYLKVKDVSGAGAWLDWGLDKDLLVPHKEQVERMEIDQSYLIYTYLDEITDRMVASSHINKFIEREEIQLEIGQEVDLLIGEKGSLGYTVIIDSKHKGLIYTNEVFRNLKPGEKTFGYIKQIREDNKIDVSLEPLGMARVEPHAKLILSALKEANGFLQLHDKSKPESIKHQLGMSKKNFKKAVGNLYKQRLIEIEDKGIRLR